jgi:hypothetical protein
MSEHPKHYTWFKLCRTSISFENVLQINALKTIRQLFVDCSMASLSLMETGDKELQKPQDFTATKKYSKILVN